MADITFSCPRCDQHAVGDEALIGMSVECPTCSYHFTVTREMITSPPLQAVSQSTGSADKDAAAETRKYTARVSKSRVNHYSPHRYSPSLVLCPDCKREVSAKARACPHCGCPIWRPSKAPIVALIVLAIVVAVIIWGASSLRQTHRENDRALSELLRENAQILHGSSTRPQRSPR